MAYDVTNDEDDYKNNLNYKRGKYAELRKYAHNVNRKKDLAEKRC